MELGYRTPVRWLHELDYHLRFPRPWPERQNEAARLNWHHFEPVYLPGYSPDFNPIERLWLRLKADWFWDFIARTEAELSDRLCTALRVFTNQPDQTASICAIRK